MASQPISSFNIVLRIECEIHDGKTSISSEEPIAFTSSTNGEWFFNPQRNQYEREVDGEVVEIVTALMLASMGGCLCQNCKREKLKFLDQLRNGNAPRARCG